MTAILDLPDVLQRMSRLSVKEYHRLDEYNENGKRTELIRGFVIEKMGKSPRHRKCTVKLYKMILAQVPVGYTAWQEEPLTLRDSEPEPDITIVRGSDDDYDDGHPSTACLVVEIAVSSVGLDRALASVYAEAGVEEYWIVLVEERAVEVYRRPVGGTYQDKTTLGADAVLACESVPGITVSLGALFAGPKRNR
ncbi:MAG TPA: Uma2 family endonuclease [Chthoniobacter sp.]|jgi:Uma2 family endonuclease